MPQASYKTVSIPTTTVREFDKDYNNYSMGMNTYLSNDVMPERAGGSNFWRLAQDARMPTLGEYETRRGVDYLSDAVGEAIDTQITSVVGAADQTFNTTRRLAQQFTAVGSGRLSKIEVNIKNASAATGTVVVALYTNASGAPGTLIAKSTIPSSAVLTTYSYLTARFASAPTIVASTVYWIVVYTQLTGSGSYNISSNTSASTASLSVDSGTTWTAQAFALNFKVHLATAGAPKGIHIAYKSDGTKVVLMAAGTTLYSVNMSTGVLTAIKTGLSANATYYSFVTINDIVYYVNGFDGLRKWNFTTESQVNTDNGSILAEHKGILFIVDATDKNKLRFSNFAAYETFTSTDFIYVPSPKTGDPIAAVRPLNGVLMIWTRYRKWLFSGDDNATFRLDPALGIKPTFWQGSTAVDGNYAYFMSDDGLYRTNGSSDELISQGAYNDILNIPNKDNTLISVNQGRLRLWYRPGGQAQNTKAYVFNLKLGGESGGTVESHDTETYVSHAADAYQDNDKLVVASSLIGQVYWQELESNDYTNLGGDINFELRTHDMHFGTPSREKEVRFWKPRLASQSGNYTITCQYAYDLRNNFQTYDSPGTQGSGSIWGAATTIWGSFTWGSTAEQQENLQIPGSYRRVAIRYTHSAARQPHRFLGHTFVGELRDLR